MKKTKNIYILFCLSLLISCTSNTIFKEPKDLIPKDSMSLLIQEMMIASSAKSMKNINLEKKISYMPFVYDKFKIDSLRFQNSNFYYMSKIDLYQEIFTDVKDMLQKRKEELSDLKNQLDSIRKDSLKFFKKKDLKTKTPLKNRTFNKVFKEKK